jgi:hypothetical protein
MGDIAELMVSIDQDKLQKPIVVLAGPNRDRLLLDGLRRVEAYRRLKRSNIPADLVKWHHEATAAIKAQLYDRSPNDSSLPKRHRMSIRDFIEYAAVLTSVPRNPDLEPEGYSPARETNRALGLSTGTWSQMRSLVNDADDPDLPDQIRRLAVETIEAVDRSGSTFQFSPLYRIWHQQRRQLAVDLGEPDQPLPLVSAATPDLRLRTSNASRNPPAVTQPPAVQRAVYGRTVGTVDGILDGLEALGPIHPNLTVTEKAEWADRLANARRRLGNVIKNLRS